MKHTFIAFIITLSIISTPLQGMQAATLADNTALIQKLLVQIQVLQTELNKLMGLPVGTSTCTFTRLLHFGVKGDDVTCLQNYLKSQGYFTEIPNGNYGPYTMSAVSQWQKANGIIAEPKEYGLWGEQSRALYTRKLTTPVIVAVPPESKVKEPESIDPITVIRPEIISSFPRGTLYGTTTVELSVTTEDPASCRYGTTSKEYAALPFAFNGSDTRFHTVLISGLVQDTEYSYYARCANSSSIVSPMKRIRFTVLPEKIIPAPVYEEAVHSNNKSFVVFDNVAYNGKPDNSFPGIKPIKILYWQNFGEGGDYEEPDEGRTREAVHFPLTATTDNLLVLDIEHWSMTPEGIPETVRKYNQVADWVKSERPELKIGYYGVPPRRNYNDAITTSTVRLAPWYATNDSLAGMVPHIDVLFPSLYTFKNDIPAWVRYAKANIAEAKRLANGKPIYPYIWFKYHNSTALKDQYIDRKFWRIQLETIRDAGADGVVIWGSEGTSIWDGTAPWWIETQSFVSTLSESDTAEHLSEARQSAPLMNATTRQSLEDILKQLLMLQEQVKDLEE
jgi:hypothetical protein